MIKSVKRVLIASSVFLMIGCGGGGSSSTPDGYDGRLVDAPVDGVNFECGDVNGTTHDGGLFGTCPAGSEVTFKIGKLILAKASETQIKDTKYNAFIGNIVEKTEDAQKISLILLSLNQNKDDSKIVLPKNIDEIVNNYIIKPTLGDEPKEEVPVSELFKDVEKLATQIVEIPDDDLNITVKPIEPEEALEHLKDTNSTLDKLPPVPQPGEQTGASS